MLYQGKDYPLTAVMYEVQEDSIRIYKEAESEVIL